MIIDIQQQTPEWLAWRMGKVGASEAAAILGKCRFNTPYSLWLVKTGKVEAFKGNAATQAGNDIEDKARASYEILNGFVDMPAACVVHDEYPEISASLDGLSDDRKKILEIKYPSQESHALALSGEVPEHYYIQCQHQMMCVPEAESCDYWSYRESNGALVTVVPNKPFQATLLHAELAFLDLVKSDIAPALTEKDAKIVSSPEIQAMCNELIALKAEKGKSAKEKSDWLKCQVIEVGGHSRIRCGSVLVSRTLGKDKFSYRVTVSGETQ